MVAMPGTLLCFRSFCPELELTLTVLTLRRQPAIRWQQVGAFCAQSEEQSLAPQSYNPGGKLRSMNGLR